MKTNKIILGLGIALLGSFAARAQNGLEGFVVEKYYQVDNNDVTNSQNVNVGNGGVALAPGSVVYRVYADLAAGYKFNSAYGNAQHPWKISTSTTFFNDISNNAVVGAQATSTTSLKQNTRMIDSYLTCGAAGLNKVGVLEADDNDGTIGNLQNILANNPGGVYGLPITGANGRDGMVSPNGTNLIIPSALGVAGPGPGDIFDANLAPGSSFSVTNGAMAAFGGIVGTTTANLVYLGQFVTDGVFGFEFNLNVANITTSVVETWVANNPQFGEYTLPALTLAPPTVSITSPSNAANFVTGSTVSITATAAASGSVTQVQFFVDGNSVGTDLTAPYAANYTAANGTHTITAIVTDNTGNTSTSSSVLISAATNQAPTISVTAPAGAITGQVVTFTATANDVDGTVASVTFSVDNVTLGTVNTTPYTYTWTALVGSHSLKASATDNLGAIGVSSPVIFNITNNIPPVVVITSPANGASYVSPANVVITANATDADGIAMVEAFVNNVSIGSFTTAGPSYTFSYVSTNTVSADVIKVVATDAAIVAATNTSSPVSITVLGAGGFPYVIGNVKQECTQSSFCLPIVAKITSTVSNVIGYDITLNYDQTKVAPAGLPSINGSFFASGNAGDAAVFTNTTTPGVVMITAYLTNTAAVSWGAGATNGTVFCVPFVKLANVSSIDTADFSIPVLQESYVYGVTSKSVDAGNYSTYKDTTFAGSLVFWANNNPLGYTSIPNNTVVITNIYGTSSLCVTNTATAVQPDANGNFVYNILNGRSIEIDRDIDNLTDIQPVVQGADVIAARAIVLNQTAVTPSVYEMIAGDANIDGVVSAGDITQIQFRSIQQIPEYKQAWNYNAAGQPTLVANTPSGFAYSKDWVYVDQARIASNPAYVVSATFPNNDNSGYSKAKVPVTPFCLALPLTQTPLNTPGDSCALIGNETYKGILIGDLNGNFSAATSSANPYRSSGDKVVIDLGKAIINGTSVEAPVTFVSTSKVTSIDFSMKFDESNLTYNSMVNYPSNTEALAYFHPVTKMLKMDATNVDLSAFSANKPVASIRFETKTGVIDSDQFNSLVGYINGESVPLEVLNKATGLTSLSGNSSVVSVFPNPTSGIINITSISDATVEIFDVTGKEVLFATTVSASKTQQVNVSNLVNGVYVVKVYNNDFITIKKVVLNK